MKGASENTLFEDQNTTTGFRIAIDDFGHLACHSRVLQKPFGKQNKVILMGLPFQPSINRGQPACLFDGTIEVETVRIVKGGTGHFERAISESQIMQSLEHAMTAGIPLPFGKMGFAKK